MRKLITRAIAVATLIFIAYILVSRFDVIRENFLRHKIYFFLIALLYIGGRLLVGLKLFVLVSRYGVKISKYECVGLAFMVHYYNLMFPNAGVLTNALYLKSKYNFAFRHFISVGILRIVFTFMIGGLIGIAASVIYMIQSGTYFLMGPVVLYFILAIVAFLAFFVPVPKFFQQYGWFDKVRDIIKGVTEIKSDIKLMLYLALIQAGVIILFITRYYIVFKALSLSASYLSVASIIPMTTMSDLINLIPSNLAIREAIVTSSSLLVGYSLSQGILVASIDRAVMLAMLLSIGSWLFLRMKYYENLVVGRLSIKEMLARNNNDRKNA